MVNARTTAYTIEMHPQDVAIGDRKTSLQRPEGTAVQVSFEGV